MQLLSTTFQLMEAPWLIDVHYSISIEDFPIYKQEQDLVISCNSIFVDVCQAKLTVSDQLYVSRVICLVGI